MVKAPLRGSSILVMQDGFTLVISQNSRALQIVLLPVSFQNSSCMQKASAQDGRCLGHADCCV